MAVQARAPETLSLTEPGRSNPGERAGQDLLLFRKHGTKIDQYATVLDAGYDWSGALAELCGKFIRTQASTRES